MIKERSLYPKATQFSSNSFPPPFITYTHQLRLKALTPEFPCHSPY